MPRIFSRLDEAPVAAVLRVVAVVAHHEVRSRGHHDGIAAVEIAAVSRRRGGQRARAHVGLVQGLAVHVGAVVLDLHRLAAHRDDALDEVSRLVVGVLEDDDVAPARLAEAGQMGIGEGDLRPVEELVDQDVVADQQGVHHGAGGDGEGLHHEGADDQRQQHRHHDGLAVLAGEGLAARLAAASTGRGSPRDASRVRSRRVSS